MKSVCIAVLIGSLRKESLNRRLARAIIKLAPAHVIFKQIEIGDLPLYNQDDDEGQAESVKRMKAEILQCDGILFVTPEYNRSVPGVLKNALDHGSRPFGKNAWAKKPAAMIGISPSPIGTALAQQHLRTILASLDMPTLCQPEMFLQMKDDLFDASGNLNTSTEKFVKKWMEQVLHWISINSAK